MTTRWLLALYLMLAVLRPGFAQSTGTPVIVAPVEQAEVIEEVPLTGTVTSSREAGLSTEISGLIDSIEVDIGDRVAAGDVILRLKSALEDLVLEARRAEVEQARRELADARRRLADAERLGRSNTVSVNEINSLKAEVSIDSAELTRLQAGEKRQQLRLRQHALRAPFAGVISARRVEQGEWVNPGTPVVDLVSLEQSWIEFQAPQWVYRRLDAVARLKVAFGASPGERFEARIVSVVPVSDRDSRTFLIRARLLDDAPWLMPGASASATLHLLDSDQGVVIDRNALTRYPDGRITVWVIDDSGEQTRVTERRVSTGLGFDGRISISEGLSPGERVVVNGNEGLREGQNVTIRSADQGR